MPDYILISDGEDDIISMSGPSRPYAPAVSRGPMRAPLSAPIFIDDSDDDEPVQSMTELVSDFLTDRKGKRKASPVKIAPIRSALLDLLDNDAMRLETPSTESEVDTPLSEGAKKKKTAPKKKVDSGDGKDKEAEAARKREEKEEKEAMKQQEKDEKARKKEQEKVDKEAAKSLAKKEKEANKLRINKSDTVREIHLYLTPDLLEPSSPIAAALPEIRTRFVGNESEVHTLNEKECPQAGVIRFKRHVKAKYDAKAKKWVILAEDRWEWESTVVLVVQAEEILDLIHSKANGLAEWASDARMTMRLKQTDQVVVMIKGLQKYYAKTKTLANREFTAAARASLGEINPVRRPVGVRADKAMVERELVKLQVAERCFLVHVEKTEEIEDWVYNLGADVAIRPYKLLRKTHLNFCPADGAATKKSSHPSDAFKLMLEAVHGITPSGAAGIVAEYPVFKDLMEAYDKAERRGHGAALLLQDCEVRNLRNGTANGRLLNKALSTKVYHHFSSTDGLALV